MLEGVFPLTNKKLGFNAEQIRACWGGFVSWRALCVSLQELLCVLKGDLCLGASVSAVCLWVALGPGLGGSLCPCGWGLSMGRWRVGWESLDIHLHLTLEQHRG